MRSLRIASARHSLLPFKMSINGGELFFFRILDGFDYMHDDRHPESFLCFYVMMRLGSCDEK